MCVCVCVCVCVCLYPYPFTLSWYSPLSEIHLNVVRGLIQLKGFNQCINMENSSERRNYIQVQQTDLPYANTKDLIQSGRIQIRVACLSLVSFRQLSKIYPISSFRGDIITSFSLQFVGLLEFRLSRWKKKYLETEIKELGRSTYNSYTYDYVYNCLHFIFYAD